MADEEQKGLDKLFSDHKERKQKERENEEIRQSEKNARRDETIELMTKTIIPILKKYKKKSKDHGHSAEIRLIKTDPAYPSVEFSFMPEHEPVNILAPSTISFTHFDAGKIKIEGEIISAKGKNQVTNEYGGRKLPQEVKKVTEQWIENELSIFIGMVLEANN